MSQSAPLVSLDPNAPVHDNIDDAAFQCLKSLGNVDSANGAEQAGVIFQNSDGQFACSTPTDSHDHDNFSLRAAVPKGGSIAGIFHTHLGEDDLAQVFSPKDVQVSNQLKVPSYVMFQGGAVRKFVPGQTKTQDMTLSGSRFPVTVARGDTVLPTKQSAAATALQNASQTTNNAPADSSGSTAAQAALQSTLSSQ
jgi:hypothetical protein